MTHVGDLRCLLPFSIDAPGFIIHIPCPPPTQSSLSWFLSLLCRPSLSYPHSFSIPPPFTLPGPWACQTVIINEENDSPRGPLVLHYTDGPLPVCVSSSVNKCSPVSVCMVVYLNKCVRRVDLCKSTHECTCAYLYSWTRFLFYSMPLYVQCRQWSMISPTTNNRLGKWLLTCRASHTTWEQWLTRKQNYLLDKAFNLSAGHMHPGSSQTVYFTNVRTML